MACAETDGNKEIYESIINDCDSLTEEKISLILSTINKKITVLYKK
jgi:hypothetical protein